MTALVARAAGTAAHRLADGPVRDPERQRLLWVGIPAGTVHHGHLTADDSVGTDGSWSFGDGSPGHQVLVRLDPGGTTVLDDDLTLSGGLAWSPDGGRMYSIDTTPRAVWVRDYDVAAGATGPRRRAFTIEDGPPDGMCADADGNLWIAIWGGGRVECRTPDGQLLATVNVAAPHPSSVTFAGPDLGILVITTAREELSPAEKAAHPQAGQLFTVRPGVRGLPVPYWDPATIEG
jgi:sugar lactone lactonase YvrE